MIRKEFMPESVHSIIVLFESSSLNFYIGEYKECYYSNCYEYMLLAG